MNLGHPRRWCAPLALVVAASLPLAAASLPSADAAVPKPAKPTLSGKPATVVEGNVDAVVRLTLSRKATKKLTVRWKTVNGTAKGGADFRAGHGSVTIARGKKQASITVRIKQDTVIEPTETFTVRLSGSGFKLPKPSVKVSIKDDDAKRFPKVLSGPFSGTVVGEGISLTWQGRVTYTYLEKDPFTHFTYTDEMNYVTTALSGTWSATGECSGSGTFTLGSVDHVFPQTRIHLANVAGKGTGYEVALSESAPMPCVYPDDRPDFDLAYMTGKGEGALIYNSDVRGPVSNRFTPDRVTFEGALDITPGNHQTWTWDLTGSGSVLAPEG